MEKENFDLVFVTNCPAFYKINLFNELNKHCKIYVVFLGYSDDVVIEDDFHEKCEFPFILLSEEKLKERNILQTFFKIKKIVDNIHYKKIIYGGYAIPEFALLSFLSPVNKNILQTESAQESVLSGWRFYLKKIILKRFEKAIASGKIHKEMLLKMGFKNPVIISKGVGILNKSFSVKDRKKISDEKKYLYVGRLIDIKRVEFLVDVFNENKKPLTIVGSGILSEKLKKKAKENIKFLGFVPNHEVWKVYSEHDIFILPSVSEPWGLVVEEALFHKCVLLLSNNIGSKTELLIEPKTGEIFEVDSHNSINNAIQKLESNFNDYQENVYQFDMEQKDQEQVKSYLQLL